LPVNCSWSKPPKLHQKRIGQVTVAAIQHMSPATIEAIEKSTHNWYKKEAKTMRNLGKRHKVGSNTIQHILSINGMMPYY
jgi:hypothetical protein